MKSDNNQPYTYNNTVEYETHKDYTPLHDYKSEYEYDHEIEEFYKSDMWNEIASDIPEYWDNTNPDD